jgi:hypothetical protein
MKKIWFAASVLALCAPAEALVIIGNSVTGTYQNGTNFGTKAVGFATGSNALLLEDIQIALGGHDSSGGSLTFTLNSDASGLPGSVIATIGSQAVAGFAATAGYTLTPASSLHLAANTTYWIQVAFPAGAPPAWDRTVPSNAPSSGLATFIGYEIDSGSGFAPSATFNAIIVEGIVDGVASSVPEPEIYAMLLASSGLLGFMARRRKHNPG